MNKKKSEQKDLSDAEVYGLKPLFEQLKQFVPDDGQVPKLVIPKKEIREFEEEVRGSYNYSLLSGAIKRYTTFADFVDTLLATIMANKQQVIQSSFSGAMSDGSRNSALARLQVEEDILRTIKIRERRLN